jgi:Antitoxin VbhA
MDDFKTKTQLDPSKAIISEEERARRQEAVEYAYASARLEGFTPSAFADEMNRRFINGEVTSEELTSAILAHCKP